MKDPKINWQLIAVDKFDRNTPPQVDQKNIGLVSGLFHLWEKTLDEGITDNGKKTFIEFQLDLAHDQLEKELPILSPINARIDLANQDALIKVRKQWQDSLEPEQFIGQLTELTLKTLLGSKNEITIQQCSKDLLEFLLKEN